MSEGKRNLERISLKIPRYYIDKLDVLAKGLLESRSSVIRMIIRYYFENKEE